MLTRFIRWYITCEMQGTPQPNNRNMYILRRQSDSSPAILDQDTLLHNAKMHNVQCLRPPPTTLDPPSSSTQMTKTAAMATAAAPKDPATCAAPPTNGDGAGDGDPVPIGFVPLLPPEMLLTIKDGQGDVSEGIILLRVIVLSGTAVGQSVPHGAETVVV